MNFNEALEAIHSGERVMRRKWGGKAKVYIVHNKLNNISHVEVRTVGNCIMYAASSEDLLANDWELVNKETTKKQINPDEIVL